MVGISSSYMEVQDVCQATSNYGLLQQESSPWSSQITASPFLSWAYHLDLKTTQRQLQLVNWKNNITKDISWNVGSTTQS